MVRKEAEDIITKTVEKQGLEAYDITWSIHFLNVDIQKPSVTSKDLSDEFQNGSDYDASKVLMISLDVQKPLKWPWMR